MIGFIVLCLFYTNFLHISAVPLPQYMVPVPVATYICNPCCPCDGGYVEYPMDDSYNNGAIPIGPFPAPIGFDPNAVQMAAPIQSDDNSNQIPSDDTTSPANPAPDNTDTDASNPVDKPTDELAHSTYIQLTQMSKNPTDFINNVNDFFSGMIYPQTT